MPKHVFNTLTVTAKTPAELAGFTVLAGKPYEVQTASPFDGSPAKTATRKEPLSFNSFIPIPATEYWDYRTEDGKLRQNWYSWNIDNWGTKWEAYDVEATAGATTDSMHYSFTTAWAPPMPVFEAMAQQFPYLKFSIRYEEENGWGAEFFSDYGDDYVVMQKEWDVPQSHSDWIAAGNPDGCVCQYDNDTECWYEDCPTGFEAE